MNLLSKYQPHRVRYWPDVENYFAKLPPQLLQQAMLLKNNLATFYSGTGQFKDVLSDTRDHPMFYWHFWLLDDLHISTSSSRAAIEKHLFLATAFRFAAIYTQELILDESSNFTNRYLALAQTLTQAADFQLTHLYPGQSTFWEHARSFLHEYAEASLATLPSSNRQVPSFQKDAIHRDTNLCGARRGFVQPQRVEANAARRGASSSNLDTLLPFVFGNLAYTKISTVGVAVSMGREDLIPPLNVMLDQLNVALEILRNISTIRHDLAHRVYTYPILKTIEAAKLDPNQPIVPEQLLGALALTGVMDEIGQVCLDHLETARQTAEVLDLPTFIDYVSIVQARIAEMVALFSIKKKATKPAKPGAPQQKPQRPLFKPYVDTLPTVIDMAERYLLSDSTFRESWEIQRRGVFRRPELVGKAFPMGLIAEIMARHGHDMSAPVDTIYQTLRATGFRYYDHDHLPPDADDIGLLLRLHAYSAKPELHRNILEPALHLVENNISESGQIPVWLSPKAAEQDHAPFTALWGDRCVAVEANLLLGLISYDWVAYRKIIEGAANHLFATLAAEGLGAGRHYAPLYTIWVNLELIDQLSSKSIATDLSVRLETARQTLGDCLKAEVKRRAVTPQDAAFLTLICLSEGLPKALTSPFKPGWITILGKTQRYDGSWPGEPLYGTPTRGEFAAWYASKSVTTALCYHALKTYGAVCSRMSG